MKNLKKNLISISQSVTKLAEKIEKMAEAIENESARAKAAKKTTAKKKTFAKAAPKNKKAAAKKKAAKKASAGTANSTAASDSGSLLDNIYQLVSSSGEGITVAEIKEKTGLAPRQVGNALYKLTKKDRIETIKRGVYVIKKG